MLSAKLSGVSEDCEKSIEENDMPPEETWDILAELRP